MRGPERIAVRISSPHHVPYEVKRSLLEAGDRLLGGVVEVLRGDDVEAAGPQDRLAGLHIGALQAHDERNLQPELRGGGAPRNRRSGSTKQGARHLLSSHMSSYAGTRRSAEE